MHSCTAVSGADHLRSHSRHVETWNQTGAWKAPIAHRCASADVGRRQSLADGAEESAGACLAVGGTVVLLHPPLPLVGVSIETMRECQQNDSLADGSRLVGIARVAAGTDHRCVALAVRPSSLPRLPPGQAPSSGAAGAASAASPSGMST